MIVPQATERKSVSCLQRAWLLLLSGLYFLIMPAASATAAPDIHENDNQVRAGHLESGILTLHLELREGIWHPDAPDGRAISVYSFAEEGHEPQMPGPLIRVPQGTELRISVHNLAPVPMFVKGLHQRPGKSEDSMQLAAGESKEVRFLAGEPGSYLYSAATSAGGGANADGTMAGAFIVDAPAPETPGAETNDRVFVIQLWDHDLFTPKFDSALAINGKAWPYTERLNTRIGRSEHWRVLNATPLLHPMHLHGFFFYVDAMGDGETERHFSGDERPMVVTEAVDAGRSFDMTWQPDRPGNWLFHCHIVDHMSGEMSPTVYGPSGHPAVADNPHAGHDASIGMNALVLGIHVADDGANPAPASAAAEPAAERNLFVRQRPDQPYVPGGAGFFLEGVSREVGAVGPPLVITRGQRTAIAVHNELKEPTAVHWHGMEIESYYDGVPGWTGDSSHRTPAIEPGGTFVAYMTPPRAGTFIYHTHWHNVKQLTSGMYGALLVMEPGQKYDPATDKVFALGRGGPNEMYDPLVLNGSPQPPTMVLLDGKTFRFRLINMTPGDSPITATLTMDGQPVKWRAIAKDGADLPAKQATERDAVQPFSVGETYDFEFVPKHGGGEYTLRFSCDGNEVSQVIFVVPASDAFSSFAAMQ
jgi:manganese oxidase